MVTIGSLFSGIGGLERGVEMAVPNARVVWQAEQDPHARAVLAHHYPGVHCYADVREIDHEAPPVDLICGGFPCQDISNAGNRAGIDGERSGLWREYARIVRVLRPRLVFIENVAALLGRGLERVLGDLAACGYDAVWETFRAADVGAPHLRDRLFVLAYGGHSEPVADPDSPGRERQWLSGLPKDGQPQPRNHADRCDCPRCYIHVFPPGPQAIGGWTGPKPAIRRGDDGVSSRLDGPVPGGREGDRFAGVQRRFGLKALGNSCVTQQATLAFATLLSAAGFTP